MLSISKVGVFCLLPHDECPIYVFFGTEIAEVNLPKDDTNPDLLTFLIALQSPGVSRSIVVPPVQEGSVGAFFHVDAGRS